MSAERLADHILRAYTGPMWHGPALRELLEGVDHAQAAAHPIPGAHSIWELVLHVRVWAEIAAARLRGEGPEYPPPERDWPAPPRAAADAWSAAVRGLEESYRALAAAVEPLAPEELGAPVAGQDHSVRDMLHGVVEHACYHGAQIALLKRALAASGATPPRH